MLDQEVIELAHRQIQIAIDEQEKTIAQKLRSTNAEFAKRGALRSGAHIIAIQKIYANATAERGMFAWETLLRCISTVGVKYTEDLESQLKTAIDRHFPAHMNGLKYAIQEAANNLGMPNITAKLPDAVGDERNLILRKIHSEIELFLIKLKTKPVEQPYSPQITIHNSTIASLQTGQGSIANVNQKFGPEVTEELSNALINLVTELAKIDSLPKNDKAEIVELTNEGIEEIKKASPNVSKIKSYISTIGEAVGFTANLKPAYETLKAAATLIGLQLP